MIDKRKCMSWQYAWRVTLVTFIGMVLVPFMSSLPVEARPAFTGPKVVKAGKHDTSRVSVRALKPRKQPVPVRREIPLYGLPHQEKADKAEKEKAADQQMLPLSQLSPSFNPETVVLQAPAMPSPLQTFDGIDNIAGVAPPDTCGDVGPDHYVQAVNLHFQVFDKSGTSLLGPLPLNTIWDGFGGSCEVQNNGDPIVLYDQWADRWFISQFALDYGGEGFHQCIAVSTTGDPTGTWHRYDFFMSDTIMNDYPKFGIWPDGYYMSINQFDATQGYSFAGQGVAVFDRNNMLVGNAAAMQYFSFPANSGLFGMLPADADGIVQPDAGEPNHFLMLYEADWGAPQDQLVMYDFQVDWTDPGNTTFTEALASPFNTDPFTWFPGDISQPGTSQLLDVIGDRLMYRLQYRIFDNHKSMVVNHTVDKGAGVAGIRWYELRDSGSGWSIYQQGSYGGDSVPDGNHRWMGSIAMDVQGNIALGYSKTNATDLYPSIWYTGRLTGEPLNSLGQGETELFAGGGSQTGTHRWGDYSMMSVDPVDDCTFWYTQEYYPISDDWDWHTRIGSFKFSGCTSGPTGELTGHVHSDQGVPLASATVQVDNGTGVVMTTQSDADGSYRFAALPEGIYTVTASSFAYYDGSVPDVQLIDAVTTTLDFDLQAKPVYTLTGRVTDAASSQVLYASINFGHGVTWTDPSTGLYSVELPEGDYVLDASSFFPGYDMAARSITLAANQTEDFVLNHLASCEAPGYAWTYPDEVLAQRFDSCSLPTGWAVNNLGGDCIWTFDDPGESGNLTGGNGCFVDANIDFCGNGMTMNTELVSPSFDCTTMATVQLEFKYDIQTYIGTDINNVDVSIDGGASWSTVWNVTGSDDPGPKTAQVDISAFAAGQADVKIRFHYQAPAWEWWWQLDDVFVSSGSPFCAPPADGGFVYGSVRDENTGQGLDGARVTSDPGYTVFTEATVDDTEQPDGFYMMYLPLSGLNELTASISVLPGYGTSSQTVSVLPREGVALDFDLPAGLLESIPASVEVSVPPDSTIRRSLDLANSGSIDASYRIVEIDGPFPLRPVGPFADAIRHMSPKHLDDLGASGARFDFLEPDVPILATAGDVVRSWSTDLAYPWGIGFDKRLGRVWIGNPAAAAGDDIDYEYGVNGASTGRFIDVSKIPQAFMADFAYDMINQTLWQLNVGGDNCIHELDTTTLKSTGDTICPAFGVSQRGLAYNLKTDTFYAGSWNDSTIHEFDRSGTVLRSVNVGLPISGLAFNSHTDHLFVMNDTASIFQVTVVDVMDNFRPRLQFSIPGFSSNAGAGLAMDCDGYLWTTDKVTGVIYQLSSGEMNDCSVYQMPWLSETPVSGIVNASISSDIALDFDATGLVQGETKGGYLIVETDTPYGSMYVPVKMHVRDLPSVSEITKESAKVSAVVDPGCQDTEYYFEYGSKEGIFDMRTTSIFSSSCSPVTIEFLLEGLDPGTTYFVRLVEVNSGTVYGPVLSFTSAKFPWLMILPAIHSQSLFLRDILVPQEEDR